MQFNLFRKVAGIVSGAALGLVLMLASGCAQSGSTFNIERKVVNGLPSVTATGTAWANVKVEAVDYSNRTIALAGDDGKSEIFQVSSVVRNFDQIKKGDVVRVEYFDELTVNVRGPNDPPAVGEVTAVARAPKGEKPGILATRVVEKDTEVVGIDYAARLVTLKDMDGKIITLTASEKLKNLDKVKKGDTVVFTYSESISIQVTKP